MEEAPTTTENLANSVLGVGLSASVDTPEVSTLDDSIFNWRDLDNADIAQEVKLASSWCGSQASPTLGLLLLCLHRHWYLQIERMRP